MKIAFEAKRVYTNGTGLGHYSRTLIHSLATFFPANEYVLLTPTTSRRFNAAAYTNVQVITPQRFPFTVFRGAWRSRWVKEELAGYQIELYHGLSHEIPFGIHRKKIPTVVTIHDLIFERYPAQFSRIDVQIYRRKFLYACRHADKIIAISQQTKEDIVQFYKIPESKIDVCYQSCQAQFAQEVSEEEKQAIKRRYRLPDRFLLSVGSIIERKNLLLICKALNRLKGKLDLPLLVIGEGGAYKKKVQQYLADNQLGHRVRFLSDEPDIAAMPSFRSAADFPAIYQQALCMIYPSRFEGFGIPVLEALWSRLPVITSNVSCLPETGGNAALYVNPDSEAEMAEAIVSVSRDEETRAAMIARGWQHAQAFTQQHCAASVFSVYQSLR